MREGEERCGKDIVYIPSLVPVVCCVRGRVEYTTAAGAR